MNSRVASRPPPPQSKPVTVDLASAGTSPYALMLWGVVSALLVLATAATVVALPLLVWETVDIVKETKSAVAREDFPLLILAV